MRTDTARMASATFAANRAQGAVKFGVPFVSLLSLQVEAFEPDKLPPDLKAIPAVKPGGK